MAFEGIFTFENFALMLNSQDIISAEKNRSDYVLTAALLLLEDEEEKEKEKELEEQKDLRRRQSGFPLGFAGSHRVFYIGHLWQEGPVASPRSSTGGI